jgi:hypothetical protein
MSEEIVAAIRKHFRDLKQRDPHQEIVSSIALATRGLPETIPIIVELMLNESSQISKHGEPFSTLEESGGLNILFHQNIGSERTPYLQIASQIIMFGDMSVDAAKYVLASGTDKIDHPYLTVSENTISLHPFIRETMNL